MHGLQVKLVLFIFSVVLAAFALTAASGFVCVGLFLLFSQYTSPAFAAFATAGSAVLFAVFLFLILKLVSKFSANRTRRSGTEGQPAMALGALLGGELLKLAQTRKPAVLAISLIAGFAVGVSPRLRAFLADLLKS